MPVSSEANHVVLSDGRRLAYAEYGDPHGQVVFFFHGAPGSRLMRHPDEAILKRLGLRMITVDRPGYGYSDPKPHRSLLDWQIDVAELADALSVRRFSLIGVSGGGPYAAACAYRLPERVDRVALVSCPAPFDVPGLTRSLKFGQRLQFTLAVKAPWIVRLMMNSYVTAARKATPAEVAAKLQHDLPPLEVELMRQPGMVELMIADTREAMRQGGEACAYEWGLMASPWGFRPEAIAVPVQIWHGDQDENVSLAMAQYLARVIPASNLTVCPGAGHLLALAHWEEILRSLVS